MKKRRAMAILIPAMLVAAAPEDAVDRVAAALLSGASAGTAVHRARAAAALRGEGAHAIDGVDRALQWGGQDRTTYRDRALGPGYRTVLLAAGASFRLDQTFLAGRRARVVAVGAAPATFTLAVGDPDGHLTCAPTATGRSCDWVPDHTARFGIDLANTGNRQRTLFLVLQ